MNVTTTDGKTFSLTGQTAEDFELLHALDMHGMHLRRVSVSRSRAKSTAGFISSGAVIELDPQSPESLRAQAGREVLRAFNQLISLGLREAALHGHVGAHEASSGLKAPIVTGGAA